MNNRLSKLYKWIAACIGALLIIQLIVMSGIGFLSNDKANISAASSTNSDEDRITAELSNMSGVSKNKILQMKHFGKSWNEIITVLPDNKRTSKNESDDRLLANGSLDEDFINQLSDEGYAKDDILQAKLQAERVLFQLQEIAQSVQVQSTQTVIKPDDNNEEDLTAYSKLAEKFDEKKAISLMLSLKKDFGGIESVLNEYLLALQIDLDLETYLHDKKKYEQDKQEKGAFLLQDSIITIDRIENKMLEIIQSENSTRHDDPSATQVTDADLSDNQVDSSLPDIPDPKPNDVVPKNPTDSVIKEIQALDPNNTNFQVK